VKAALPPEAAGEPVGVRFRDEARVGRRGTLARSWARRGTRPRAPRDRRCARACLFGAALVPPCVSAGATSLHPAEIGCYVAPATHAVVVLDGAGGHAAADLAARPITSPFCRCRHTRPS
jgi:hypothetical protein